MILKTSTEKMDTKIHNDGIVLCPYSNAQCFASNIAGPYNVICSIHGHPGVVLQMRHLNTQVLTQINK